MIGKISGYEEDAECSKSPACITWNYRHWQIGQSLYSAAIWRAYVSFVRALKKKVDEGQGEDDEEQEGGN